MKNSIGKKLYSYLIFFGLMICISSCEGGCNKKSTSPKSTWQIGTNNYSASSAAVVGNSISASNDINSFYVYFANLPTVSGSYQVVAYNANNPYALTGNQVAIEVNTSLTDVYLSTGSGNVMAQVTVSGSKINVTVPTIWAQHNNSSGVQADSLQTSGTLLQY